MYEYMYLLRYRLGVNRAEISGPARKIFFFGPARPAINVLENLYCTMFLKSVVRILYKYYQTVLILISVFACTPSYQCLVSFLNYLLICNCTVRTLYVHFTLYSQYTSYSTLTSNLLNQNAVLYSSRPPVGAPPQCPPT